MVTITIPGTLLALVGAAMLAFVVWTLLTTLDRLDTWRQRRVQDHSIRTPAEPATQPQSAHLSRRMRTHAPVLSTSRQATSSRDHDHTPAPRR